MEDASLDIRRWLLPRLGSHVTDGVDVVRRRWAARVGDGLAAGRRGASVVGLEQFELGHLRGASHDTSRILRRSYHTPAYVRLAGEAYDDWADLEREPASGWSRAPAASTSSRRARHPGRRLRGQHGGRGVPFEQLVGRVVPRWPALRVPDGTVALAAGRHVDRARGPVDPATGAAGRGRAPAVRPSRR
jgi:hypothetical protein